MTTSTFERNATIAEMAVEIDRRGAVIEQLEAAVDTLTAALAAEKQRGDANADHARLANLAREGADAARAANLARAKKAEAERDAAEAALRALLATGLNGGNNVRLAFIAAGGKALDGKLLEQAEASERAVQNARAIIDRAALSRLEAMEKSNADT